MKIPSLIRSEMIYEAPFLSLRKDYFVREDGREIYREVVMHAQAAVIVPVLGPDQFVLIRQFRHAIGQTIYEFPAGMIDENEDPLEGAKRELNEETGYHAQQWQVLTGVYPAPGFCDEYLHFFLAKDLYTGEMNLDDDEILEPVFFSSAQLDSMIESGEINDAKTVMAYLYVKRYASLSS